jgi:hypothetical protein
LAAYRNRLLGWTTTQLGLSVSPARPSDVTVLVAASNRHAKMPMLPAAGLV